MKPRSHSTLAAQLFDRFLAHLILGFTWRGPTQKPPTNLAFVRSHVDNHPSTFACPISSLFYLLSLFPHMATLLGISSLFSPELMINAARKKSSSIVISKYIIKINKKINLCPFSGVSGREATWRQLLRPRGCVLFIFCLLPCHTCPVLAPNKSDTDLAGIALSW